VTANANAKMIETSGRHAPWADLNFLVLFLSKRKSTGILLSIKSYRWRDHFITLPAGVSTPSDIRTTIEFDIHLKNQKMNGPPAGANK
jgi:hypothetical protein